MLRCVLLLIVVGLVVPRCYVGGGGKARQCHYTREWQMEPVGSCWVGVL